MILFSSQLKSIKKLVLIALLLFVAFGLVGCSTKYKIENKENKQIRKKVVFDIPSFLEKDANEIKKILGRPSFDGNHFGNYFKSLEWKKNNYEFRFDLNPDGSIRKKTLMLFGYVENKATVKSTLEAGNLNIKSKKYDVLLGSDGTVKRIISIYIRAKK